MIIFLHGDDTYRSREKLHEIIREYQKRHTSGINLVRVDMEEPGDRSPCEIVAEALRTQSMFEEKKLIVIERPFNVRKEDREELLDLLKNEKAAKDDDVVMVVWNEGIQKNKQREKLFLFFKKQATVQEFELLHGRRLNGWIREEVANLNFSITKEGMNALLSAVGEDLWRLSAELRKLRDYAAQLIPKEDEKIIDVEHVRELVVPTIETDIFQTIDALGQRNKTVAMTLLRNHLERGEEDLRILAMFAYQVRILLQIKDLVERGVAFRDLAKRSKLHPFVVKKSFQQTKAFTFSDLRYAHRLLFELDYRIKTGAMDGRSALEHFVLSL